MRRDSKPIIKLHQFSFTKYSSDDHLNVPVKIGNWNMVKRYNETTDEVYLIYPDIQLSDTPMWASKLKVITMAYEKVLRQAFIDAGLTKYVGKTRVSSKFGLHPVYNDYGQTYMVFTCLWRAEDTMRKAIEQLAVGVGLWDWENVPDEYTDAVMVISRENEDE